MSSDRRSGRRFSLLCAGCLLLVSAIVGGCGKKGPPLPPLRDVPAPAKDLSVRQRGNQLLFSFTYPKTTPGGQALAGVSGVEIWEVARPVPPTPPASPDAAGASATATPTAPVEGAAQPSAATAAPETAAAPAPGTPAATPPAESAPAAAAPETPGSPTPSAPGAAATPESPAAPVSDTPPALEEREFALAAKKVLALAAADVGAATQGDKLVLTLPVADPIPTPKEVRHFRVFTLGPTGDRSEGSNVVRIVPQTPPVPPVGIELQPKAEGIEITWQPVPGALGYLIYRREAETKSYGNPVQAIVAPAGRLLDSQPKLGSSYIYAVTSVFHRAPIVESAIQSEREVRYVDRFPPPAVTDLVALAEEGRVRLIWSAVDASDLAGYRVYRSEGGGEMRRLTDEPIAATELTDARAASGRTYTYRVVAVDTQGNESPPQETQAIPR